MKIIIIIINGFGLNVNKNVKIWSYLKALN